MGYEDLRQLFLVDLERRLSLVEAALTRAEADPCAWPTSGETIAAELHDVKGTGATMGFAGVTAAARRMERLLADDPPPLSDLHRGVEELRIAAGLGRPRHA